jgi:hypothetical protein
MSSGSLGRPGDGAECGPDDEREDEHEDDEDKDGVIAPESDWRKAWALSSSLGCRGTVVVGDLLDDCATGCGDDDVEDEDDDDDDDGRKMRRPRLVHNRSSSSSSFRDASTLGCGGVIGLVPTSANATFDEEAGVGMGDDPIGSSGFCVYSPERYEVYDDDGDDGEVDDIMSPTLDCHRPYDEEAGGGGGTPKAPSPVVEDRGDAASRILLDHFHRDAVVVAVAPAPSSGEAEAPTKAVESRSTEARRTKKRKDREGTSDVRRAWAVSSGSLSPHQRRTGDPGDDGVGGTVNDDACAPEETRGSAAAASGNTGYLVGFLRAWALSSSMGCRGGSVVADDGVGGRGGGDVVVDDDDSIEVAVGGHDRDKDAGGARPRLDRDRDRSTSSSSSLSVDMYSALCNPTPRTARYLCASSILLAVCSLGLAATGLGLMYFTTANDDGNGIGSSSLSGSGSDGIGSGAMIDLATRPSEEETLEQQEFDDWELVLDVDFDGGVDEEEEVPLTDAEFDDDGDGTGPKSKLTDAPTSSTTEAPTYSPTMAPVEPTPTASPSMSPILLVVPATLLSTTLYSIADTWIEYNDSEAHGSKDHLKVDGVDPRAALLKFDFSSILEDVRNTDNIVGVMLRLFSIADGPFGGKIDLLDGECNDWDEYEISWMNAPECVFQNGSDILVGRFEEEIPAYEWNEAVIFLDFDGDDDSTLPGFITLRVSSNYPNGIMYASRENVTAVPELVVYYTEPSPTVSPTIAVPSEGPTRAPSSSPVVPTPTMSPLKAPTGNPTVSFQMNGISLYPFPLSYLSPFCNFLGS